jgi:predicted acylesterase/phospholipase RssA
MFGLEFTMPLDVQLSFQGGGARIPVLLAAAEAVQELERSGQINVRRIAGTSAGAIAGAFLAAGINISDVRTRLCGEEGVRLLAAFASIGRVTALLKAYLGTPFWRDDVLAEWLNVQFQGIRTPDGGPLRIKHLTKPLIVVSANIEGGTDVKHGGDDELVSALLQSSGLPFVFRTWKSAGHTLIMDGGLCENLPIDDLLAGVDAHGRVIAFSFQRPRPGKPEGILKFGMSLLDVAINHSVQAARGRVGAESVCTLNHQGLTTFDFKQARSFLDDGRYATTKREVHQWFEELLQRNPAQNDAQFSKDIWTTPKEGDLRKQMQNLGTIYESQHVAQKLRFHTIKLLATANSLAKFGEEGHGKPDDVFFELTFEPIDLPVFAYRLTLTSPCGSDFFGRYSTELFDQDGRLIPFKTLASVCPDAPSLRELIAFFTPPLRPHTGQYRLSLQDLGVDLLDKLDSTDKEDSVVIGLKRACGTIGRIEIGVRIPEHYRPIHMNRTNPADILFRNMTLQELRQSFGTKLGYRTDGWVAENVPASDQLEVYLGS